MIPLPSRQPPLAAKANPAHARGPEAKVRYDDAQMRVIECRDPMVVAEAFAGAGKTTTAVGFTEARPNTRFLYLCFNRANAQEARLRFGPHVECKTGHALAWAAVGRKYGNQIVQGGWRARQMAEEVGIADVRTAAIAQGILLSFFASPDRAITEEHAQDVRLQYAATDAEIVRAMDVARFAWNAMRTPGGAISVPHDAYLKVWVLSKPRLPFEHIILDEAQDTNPVMVDLVRHQNHAKLLLIGDRHQSIYGFRKAYNAMELFSAMGATVLKMPRTWRFGPDIARVANALLSQFKDEDTAIIGAGPSSPMSSRPARAVLSRTNAGLFKEAAEVRGKGIYWVGGVESYRIDQLMDAWHLRSGKTSAIASPVLRKYRSWSEFSEEVETTKDPEARLLVKFIDAYHSDTPDLVQAFRQRALPDPTQAKLILATAHKSKGLDFDRVVVGEDFECIAKAQQALLENPGEPLQESLRQEINLLYVAVTRAKHKLELNAETQAFLQNLKRYQQDLRQARSRVQPDACNEHESERETVT